MEYLGNSIKHTNKWAQNMLNFELWLLRKKKYMKGRKEYSINR